MNVNGGKMEGSEMEDEKHIEEGFKQNVKMEGRGGGCPRGCQNGKEERESEVELISLKK